MNNSFIKLLHDMVYDRFQKFSKAINIDAENIINDIITKNGLDDINDIGVRIPIGGKHSNKGDICIISKIDEKEVMKYKWHKTASGYVKKTDIFLHRFIMNRTINNIDHLSQNKLDNRRSNLIDVNHNTNSLNQSVSTRNKSGKKGVCFVVSKNKWTSKITIDGITYSLGDYINKEDAIKAREIAELKYIGKVSDIIINTSTNRVPYHDEKFSYIPITGKLGESKNLYTKISKDDFESVNKIKWHMEGSYVRNTRKGLLHRYIMNEDNPFIIIDHINRDELDNSRGNLRIVTKSENRINSVIQSNNKTGTKGLYYKKDKELWCVYIRENGNSHYLGSFKNKNDAIKARLEGEKIYHQL